MRLLLASLLTMLGSLALPAHAGDVCPQLRTQTAAPDPATRIAAVACNEHLLWYRPFIDRQGRLARAQVMEAEDTLLEDQATPAWQRVALYWRETGLLSRLGVGDTDSCLAAPLDPAMAPRCRSFVVDYAWSAAFVSWTMQRAGVPGFRLSASHMDYVRDAFRAPERSPFLPVDPALATPAQGDLLCHVRGSGDALGFTGLQRIAKGRDGLSMHCDIVVAANPGGDSTAYLVGGNVQQAVTMRLLPLNRKGAFWGLLQRNSGGAPCTPDNEAACNFNRQDWAVLLKLKPAAELARLQGTSSAPESTPTPPEHNDGDPVLPQAPVPSTGRCCVQCVVGGGVPRCPAAPSATPAPPAPVPETQAPPQP
ncbi:DUF2272 domain-containing protein [Pseudoxanthomonas composti]|uniref:DUF2272 domain-containing protein n=1 Tax=Pseudoxanthomonas composti TaxID=2137479 RepID=A0A4Q1JSS6_9GAMM|nr:DUF2272 domain-containing protein [Pseudoxanthomonas composti]RXR03414.1 DUF2272 domain-containing protein [Pseudoxanthomonas composti]